MKNLQELKAELEIVSAIIPETHYQLDHKNKYLFFLAREIEKLEDPVSYKENKNHWEGHEMRM